MELTTRPTSLFKPSKRQETWKPQFTDEQRANFERIAAIDRRANDRAYARELVQMFYWHDPRDRKQWFAETMQRISMMTPHAWSLMAFDEALSNPEPHLATVLRSSGVLVGFAAAFFVAGCLRFSSYKE